ncbi:MAG: ABC transporter ATP-binding protein [Desulfovibrio sp.]|nr:MAG: ABC transporter ATP-binding protein [Desulfovibrio sp.]
MLTVKNLDVHYGKIHAVKRVSLHVRPGEIVSLIGGNGAGKTTLLSTISGLIKPTRGNVAYTGRDITKSKPDAIVKMGVSQVPEGRLVFKPMSVEDNLLLGAYNRKAVRRRAKLLAESGDSEIQEVPQVAEDLDKMYAMFPVLGDRRKQQAGTLSGGEQQMLAMARALMSLPHMLLLDEPSMGLAPTISQEIFRHITKLRNDFGLTVLLVEQNARAALKIADRGYVLETGRIILQGPAQELMANKDVQRAYLGRDVGDE